MILDFCLELTELLFNFTNDLIDAPKKIAAGIARGKIRFIGHGNQQIDDRGIRFFQIHGDFSGNDTFENPAEFFDFGSNQFLRLFAETPMSG